MTPPLLTVFTPTFNRVHLLPRLYASLLRQTAQAFCWLLIDDGSTDGTGALVLAWILEGRIPITYHWKPNGGMHTAHNAAYERITTELNVCIDSDDWMPDDAVERITACWKEFGSQQVAGIIGLDADAGGKLIGTALPADRATICLGEFYAIGGRGDKKLVYRTDLIRRTPPYPEFPGETYVGLIYKYTLVDQECPLLVLNAVLCVVDYQADGSSLNMLRQYWRNPRGFAFLRKVDMVHGCTWQVRTKAAIHYGAKSLMLRNKAWLQESPRPWLTLVTLPLGLACYAYLLWARQRLHLATRPPGSVPP